MKRQRRVLLALICVLIITNTAVIFAASYETADASGGIFQGNIKGYVSAMIADSTWGRHRGRSYAALLGSDAKLLNKIYAASSSIGELYGLGRPGNWSTAIVTSEECTKHWYFSEVTTSLKTETKDVLYVKVKD